MEIFISSTPANYPSSIHENLLNNNNRAKMVIGYKFIILVFSCQIISPGISGIL